MTNTPSKAEIEALVKRHGATSYRNRSDTRHPAYGFTEVGLQGLIAEVRKQDDELIQQMLEALETCDESDGYTGLRQFFDEKAVESAITAARARLSERRNAS